MNMLRNWVSFCFCSCLILVLFFFINLSNKHQKIENKKNTDYGWNAYR